MEKNRGGEGDVKTENNQENRGHNVIASWSPTATSPPMPIQISFKNDLLDSERYCKFLLFYTFPILPAKCQNMMTP